MSDPRSEARRRKILQNAERRLEKLQGLNTATTQSDVHKSLDANTQDIRHSGESREVDTELFEEKFDEKQSMMINNENDQDTEENIVPDVGKNEFDASDISDGQQRKETITEEAVDEPVIIKKSSWLMRKYRFILFALLGWVVYLVVIKDFDFILAYIIGHQLPKHALPKLFLTVFVAVELQVLIADLWLGKPKQHSSSMLILALRMSGIPVGVVNIAKQILTCLANIVSDFCVYLFVVVTLKAADI